MTKKNKSDYVSDWSNTIRNMKITIEHYYLKDDTEQKQPYKVTGIQSHFNTGEEFVHFYPLRTEESGNFILEKKKFLEQFTLVTKEM